MYQTGSHGEEVEVVGLFGVVEEVHEGTGQDDDSDEGG